MLLPLYTPQGSAGTAKIQYLFKMEARVLQKYSLHKKRWNSIVHVLHTSFFIAEIRFQIVCCIEFLSTRGSSSAAERRHVSALLYPATQRRPDISEAHQGSSAQTKNTLVFKPWFKQESMSFFIAQVAPFDIHLVSHKAVAASVWSEMPVGLWLVTSNTGVAVTMATRA